MLLPKYLVRAFGCTPSDHTDCSTRGNPARSPVGDRLGRKIGSPPERLARRCQKHRERPAAMLTGQHLHGACMIDVVDDRGAPRGRP